MNDRMERYTVESVAPMTWSLSVDLSERDMQALRKWGAALVAAERERCAKSLDLKASDLRLMAGEMNAGGLRTVMAVLD